MRTLTWSVALTAVLLVTSLATYKTMNAQDLDNSRTSRRTVSVNGEGKASADPDRATIQFSVVSRDLDPEVARAANSEASAKAMSQLRDAGIDEKDIKMQQLSLNPLREWDPDRRQQKEVGFEVQRSVLVEIEDLSLVPTLVARIVQNGANRIGGVAYGLSNDDELRAEALRRAVANAKTKAETMLGQIDESLGRVVGLQEQSMGYPGPAYRTLAMEAADKGPSGNPEAFAPGQIEVTAQVSATFEIAE